MSAINLHLTGMNSASLTGLIEIRTLITIIMMILISLNINIQVIWSSHSTLRTMKDKGSMNEKGVYLWVECYWRTWKTNKRVKRLLSAYGFIHLKTNVEYKQQCFHRFQNQVVKGVTFNMINQNVALVRTGTIIKAAQDLSFVKSCDTCNCQHVWIL